MDYIIERSDAVSIKEKKNWLLIYGRRKVGKTFLLRELCKFGNYYTVKKDLNIITEDRVLTVNEGLEEIKKLLSENKRVVLDEFQRLNESTLEELSVLHPKGQLIISGSSLRIVKKIFEPQSPLLGFFMPMKIGFIRPSDAIRGVQASDFEKRIELATFLREPWIIPLYNKEKIDEYLYEIISKSRYTITALMGEIFTEEERELTKKYEAIISLIGSGTWNTKQITALLYGKRLIPDPSPTHVIQYLKNLEEMEIVESIKLHKAKGRYYRLTSPIMNIYYYMESRYDISSRPISLDEMRPTLEKLMHLEIQNFIADLFAELYDGRKEYSVSPDKEVDFIISKRNKSEIIGEVKWKKVSQEDLNKFIKNTERLQGKRILICKSGEIKDQNVEVLNAKQVVEQVLEVKKSA